MQLRNYKGERVNIDQYKGKAVLITFLYTKCPDVCPLIAANLGVALNKMGSTKAAKVQVIAVSVDPRGDTPKAVASFLQRHGVAGRMQYLIGSAHELGSVWKAWGVGAEADAEQPQLVNHSGLVYGISWQREGHDRLRSQLHPPGNRARRAATRLQLSPQGAGATLVRGLRRQRAWRARRSAAHPSIGRNRAGPGVPRSGGLCARTANRTSPR